MLYKGIITNTINIDYPIQIETIIDEHWFINKADDDKEKKSIWIDERPEYQQLLKDKKEQDIASNLVDTSHLITIGNDGKLYINNTLLSSVITSSPNDSSTSNFFMDFLYKFI